MPRFLASRFVRRGAPPAAVLALLPFAAAGAQAPAGFTPATASRQAGYESQLRAHPDTARLRAHVRWLAAETHVAGTPRQAATADYVLQVMARAGLDTMRASYDVWLPHPDSAVVEVIVPTRRRLPLVEPAVAGDPTSGGAQWPTVNGYSAAGDVTASVVYVNYGLIEDYAQLRAAGVDVRGKIAIARYGRSFRGIKAREAERHGAVALLMYSDPADDGYVQGDAYPEGPMRPAAGVQRGSVMNGQGDPSTPGWASRRGARRVPLDSMDVPRIPVVPISWANAAALLEPLRGAALPAQSWQGGLPFRYHVGGDATVQARVGVWLEPAARHVKTIVNTVGILRGATQPDEWVLTGAHRDGWGPGATDNVAGTAVVLASAEAFGAAAARGQRPARSLVFLTWDAEEWGIIGSTEWAEDHADELRAKAVAYLNQDGTVGGRRFGASATASLHGFVREAASAVGQPGDTGSVRAAWERASGGAPRFGDLGGGSDFFGFYNYLGIPSFDFGFGGPGGVYHSQYDSYAFVERFADPGYLAHVAAAQLNATMLARLANADLLPFDYGAYGRYLGALAPRIAEAAQGARLDVDPAPLAAAAARLAAAGDAFAATRDSVLAAGRARRDALARANAALRTVEHALTRESGLAGRPRARNLVFAADRDNGYSNMPFPSVLEAIRDGDAKRAQAEVVELAGRIDDARARVEAARRALGGA